MILNNKIYDPVEVNSPTAPPRFGIIYNSRTSLLGEKTYAIEIVSCSDGDTKFALFSLDALSSSSALISQTRRADVRDPDVRVCYSRQQVSESAYIDRLICRIRRYQGTCVNCVTEI